MAYTYWLPDENGNIVDYTTESNSVIIVGANGAGKSKLGAWIEQQNFEGVHRIGSQRSLVFNENIQLKSYAEAENYVFYGTDISVNGYARQNKSHRWNKKYTTTLLNDFENVLAALLAKTNNEEHDYVIACKRSEKEGTQKPDVPIMILDKLKQIWDEIFPQRRLSVNDAKFYASFSKDGIENKYSATEMSDGERSVLYLASQVLCVPENKVLIMDEPELHLHPSIMNRLWQALEKYRSDCLFIYITHDLQFASMHSHADKIWIKEYDGRNWKLQKIEDKDLPEELLLEILGSRKNVIFVEGESNSYFSLFNKYNNDPYMIISSAYVELGYHNIYDIISVVENKLLDALILLEKEFGCLDELDIDISDKNEGEIKRINEKIQLVLLDQSISIGNNNNIKSSDFSSQNQKSE